MKRHPLLVLPTLLLGIMATVPGPAEAAPLQSASISTAESFPSLKRSDTTLPLWNQGDTIVEARRRVRYRSRRFYSFPRWGAPVWSTGGAARGGCSLQESPLVPLMPVIANGSKEPSFFSVTVVDRPTFFAYVPTTTARQIEFLLVDEEAGDVVYEQAKSVDGTPQILSFSLDGNAPALNVGKNYKWFFTTICNPKDKARDDNSGNPSISGLVQRHPLTVDATRRIAAAPPRDRPSVYAEEGGWLDSLNALAQLRCQQPNDSTIRADWQELLQDMKLEQIAALQKMVSQDQIVRAPLAQCRAATSPVF